MDKARKERKAAKLKRYHDAKKLKAEEQKIRTINERAKAICKSSAIKSTRKKRDVKVLIHLASKCQRCERYHKGVYAIKIRKSELEDTLIKLNGEGVRRYEPTTNKQHFQTVINKDENFCMSIAKAEQLNEA